MTQSKTQESFTPAGIPEAIFRAYDIRGVVEEQLSADVVYQIARAIGSEAIDLGIHSLLVGCDGRLSSPELSRSLIGGLLESGVNVVNLGMVPTPLLYFAAHETQYDSGVMLTASHNPADYNGLKIVFRRTCLADNQIQSIRTRILNAQIYSGKGQLSELNIQPDYISRIVRDITIERHMKVVIDCGNAVPAITAPELFTALGCEVIPLYCDVDGRFPNHHPDPTRAENLLDLSAAVIDHGADLGIAFDGDGDRLGVVDEKGQFINADSIMGLLVKRLAPHYQGQPIVFDVKCSRHLAQLIEQLGCEPVMHRSGHSFMKQKMQETNAPLGGEFAAHIFIKDRWYGYDDGLYAAARVIEALSVESEPASSQLDTLGDSIATPEISIAVPDAQKFDLMRKIARHSDWKDACLIKLDGIRAEFTDGWGLIRASNTSPALLLRFEADNLRALHAIQAKFKALLKKFDVALDFDFMADEPNTHTAKAS